MSEVDLKKQLRAAYRHTLGNGSVAERSQAAARICQRVMALSRFASARVVMLYSPLPDEVDMSPVSDRCGVKRGERGPSGGATPKVVCLPQMDWPTRTMKPVAVDDLSKLVPFRHGVLAPPVDAEEVPLAQIDLVIVPGLAFDRDGFRLGRGAGFYDRFLAQPELRGAFFCGVVPSGHLAAVLPRDVHDVPVHAVITDREAVFVGRSEGTT